MKIKHLCFVVLFGSIAVFGQNNLSKNYDEIIADYKQLSLQQLLDTAKYYNSKNSTETALVYCNLIISTPLKDSDLEQQKIIAIAYNGAGKLLIRLGDYSSAYDLLIKGLIICEKNNFIELKTMILNNLGFVYSDFEKFDISRDFFIKALDICDNSIIELALLNNLANNAIKREIIDSAFYWIRQAIHTSRQNSNYGIETIFCTMAETYQKAKQYDSAFYYFKSSIYESKKNDNPRLEAGSLSKLSSLFFEVNKIDSTLFYIELSNTLAENNKVLPILADNYLILSQIEEIRGNTAKELEYFKIYANLKESIFSNDKFGEINQLQRLYEVSKTNQQIEQLLIEQQIKERTNIYLKIIIGILLLLLIVSIIAIYLKKKLKKYSKIILSKSAQKELLEKILDVMDNTAIICDSEFSMQKLAEIIKSNHGYVSYVINDIMKKNFRSFLNSYRIKEAQHLFSTLDTKKYTIDSIAQQIGFKSSNSFRSAFKEVTGVTPSVYLQSLKIEKE